MFSLPSDYSTAQKVKDSRDLCVFSCVYFWLDTTAVFAPTSLCWVSVTSFIKQDSCWFRLQDCRHTESLFSLFFCPLACISGSSLPILSWTLQAKDDRLMTRSCAFVGTHFSCVLANKALDFRELNAVDDFFIWYMCVCKLCLSPWNKDESNLWCH